MRKLYILIFAMLICCPVFAQPSKDSIASNLDEYFTALTLQQKFNGNVFTAINGNIILDKSYNITALPESLKVTRESRFIIASVSKLFIKYSILKLGEDNRLSLLDRLDKFIPDFPSGDKITIQQLMEHKSGLPRELTDYESYYNLTLEKIVELAKKEKLQFEPGAQMLYSNVGFSLLHYIISKASIEGYPAFTQQKILEPLGMINTGEYNSMESIPNFAYGFEKENGILSPIKEEYINRFESGNYFSTVEDMYKFANGILTGNAVSETMSMRLLDNNIIKHAGGRPGYRAYFYMDINSGLTFIMLSNFSGIPFDEIVNGVQGIAEGKLYTMPVEINRSEIKLDSEILQRYTGKFALEADASLVFTITVEGGKLVLADKDGEKTNYSPDSETTFFYDPASKEGLEFVYDNKTNTYNLIILSDGLNLRTKRIE